MAGRLLLATVMLVVAGCGGVPAESASEEPATEPAATEVAASEPAATASAASACIATPESAESIAEGFTVSGATLVNPYAVELTEDNALGVRYLVAAELNDAGVLAQPGDIGTWAVGELGGGPIIAVDGFAKEFTDWGAAAQEGSPAAEARDALQVSDAAGVVKQCVEDAA